MPLSPVPFMPATCCQRRDNKVVPPGETEKVAGSSCWGFGVQLLVPKLQSKLVLLPLQKISFLRICPATTGFFPPKILSKTA